MSDRLVLNIQRMADAAERMDARAAVASADDGFVPIGTLAHSVVAWVALRQASEVQIYSVDEFLKELARRTSDEPKSE